MARKIYIDSNYHCHLSNTEGTFREIETSFFDGKCVELIEGYRFIPSGEESENEEGLVFKGEMIAPWKEFNEIDSYQRNYEHEMLEDAENALSILLGGESE